MITFLVCYLVIGGANFYNFVGKGGSMLFVPGRRRDGMFEAAFFVLLWPLQALFLVFVGLNVATEWALGKLFG